MTATRHPIFFGYESQWWCQSCDWSNHELRKKCRNCGAEKMADETNASMPQVDQLRVPVPPETFDSVLQFLRDRGVNHECSVLNGVGALSVKIVQLVLLRIESPKAALLEELLPYLGSCHGVIPLTLLTRAINLVHGTEAEIRAQALAKLTPREQQVLGVGPSR